MDIKLSVAVAGADADPSAFVVWRGFEESIRKAAAFGYDGVELALKTASDLDGVDLDRLLSQENMAISCISTGQVFAGLGLYFTHPDPDARQQVTQVFHDLIDLAAGYGVPVNIGRARGFVASGQTADQARSLFRETAEPVCAYAAKRGIDIIIEPVNRYEINFINSVADGAQLCRELGWSNLGLMSDVFHMNIEDAHIGKALIDAGPLVRYIHLADSNRHAPGEGHLDFDEVFMALETIGYSGWASIEILPEPSPDEAARKAAQTIRPMLERYRTH